MRLKNPVKTITNIALKGAPLEAQLIVTRRCNLSCGYCTEYDKTSEPVALDVLKRRIDALHKLHVVNVSILGGEPLMHPDIAEVVAYADKKCQVSITTNGGLITKEMVEKLNRAGLANMEVSIDTLYADRSGYVQKSLKTIGPKLTILKEHATFDVHVNLVLCDNTKEHFQQTLKEIEDHGFIASIDLLHEADGRVAIGGEEYLKLWDYHYKEGKPITAIDYDYGKQLLQGERPKWKCRAGSRSLYVDEFGLVQYCSSQRGRLNKPVESYTRKDLKEQSKTFKGCEEGCGLLCVYRDSLIDNAPLKTLHAAYQGLTSGALEIKRQEVSPA